MNTDCITTSAPGRICLFGEHQDYLGLPVVAAAVNLRARLSATPSDEPHFVIDKPDTGERETINLNEPIVYERARDYFKSGVRVMQKRGYEFTRGYVVSLTSDIPIAKGCSGSSAILVAWIGLLDIIGGENRERLTPEQIAALAYEAEVLVFNEPGGMMDHFASACGGVLHIETAGEFRANRLPAPWGGVFVLGDSLEPKDTTGVLARVKKNALAGFDYLKRKSPGFDIAAAELAETEKLMGADVAEPVRRAVLANIQNRDITRLALKLFNACGAGGAEMGTLLDAHHVNLRELGISTPRIEELVAAAKDAGAAGCKINGSGGGGCIIAFCATPEPVALAIEDAGGKAFILEIDEGVRGC